MWNKYRLVWRRPGWKIYSICTLWILLESKLWRFLINDYIFLCLCFSCEERLFLHCLGDDGAVGDGDADDSWAVSQEQLKRREGLLSVCMLAGVHFYVKFELWITAKFLPKIYLYCWDRWGYILLEWLWKNLCGLYSPGRQFSQSFLYYRLPTLPLKANRELDPKLLDP